MSKKHAFFSQKGALFVFIWYSVAIMTTMKEIAEQTGGIHLHCIPGAQRTRRRQGKSRARQTRTQQSDRARVQNQSVGAKPAYQQNPNPRLHQRGSRHHAIRRRHHSGRAGRGQRLRLHAVHRQHRRQGERGKRDRHTEKVRRGRILLFEDVEPHRTCSRIVERIPRGDGGRHRPREQSAQHRAGRVHDRLRRHESADPGRMQTHRIRGFARKT